MPATISKKTWLGLGIESTPGTAIANPVRYVPCKSTIKADRKEMYADEDRGTRDKNFAPVLGTRQGTLSAKGRWFNDACVPFLYGAFGGYSVAQPDAVHAPTVYKHTITLADVPPVFTLFKTYTSQSYAASYGAISKFSLKLSADKLLEHDTEFTCRFPLNWTVGSGPTFTGQVGFAGYAPTITSTFLGASTTDIVDMDIEFTQKVEPWTPAAGSADYQYLYFGDRECKLSYTARFDVSTLFTNFAVAATSQTPNYDNITFDVQGPLIVNSGGSGTPPNVNYYQELNFNFPLVVMDSFEWDEGKTNLLVKVKATVVPDPTLVSQLFTCFVQNTVATYANG